MEELVKTKYRTEMDAMNALVIEQRRTNAMLEQIITLLTTTETALPIEDKPKRTYTRRNQNVSELHEQA